MMQAPQNMRFSCGKKGETLRNANVSKKCRIWNDSYTIEQEFQLSVSRSNYSHSTGRNTCKMLPDLWHAPPHLPIFYRPFSRLTDGAQTRVPKRTGGPTARYKSSPFGTGLLSQHVQIRISQAGAKLGGKHSQKGEANIYPNNEKTGRYCKMEEYMEESSKVENEHRSMRNSMDEKMFPLC